MPIPAWPHLVVLLTVGWAAAVGLGTTRLWTYASTAGVAARPTPGWPHGTSLSRRGDVPTLVLSVHPHCPCSRATIGELAKLMAACHGKLDATVLMHRPAGMPDGWERTDLWTSASAIPGVRVVTDPGGVESRRFGAATSGQALLYAADGRTLFAGGITESRGHGGDNAGRSAIVSLVLNEVGVARAETRATTPVYGCPLFDETTFRPIEGSATCPK